MNTNQAQAMQASFPWLTALILVALLGAVALWAVKPARKAALPFGVSLSALIFFAFLAAAAFDFDMDRAGTVQLSETYSWIPPIGASIAWGVNGMGLVMIGLATFLVPLVLLAARDELSDQGEDRAAGYVAWILALEAIVIAIFAARDVFLFYVLFELMILPVYVLVARYGGEGRHRAAIKFVLYSLFGGLVMLAGVIGLAVTASSDVKGSSRLFLVDTLAGHGAGPRLWIFASFFLAFAIKAPLFPVHTWLPDTAEQAPPGTSALLVGVLDKLGVFGMISLCLPIFPKASHDGAPLIMDIAVVSILWGAFMAIASKDLMRLVAYTSVSHFGFIVLGVFSGSHTAMTGAIVYMVAHGVATSALFLTVGFLGRRGPGYAIGGYGGWQRATPLIAGVFLTAGLATIALPGLSGFVPEYLVLVGTFARHPVPACAAVLAVILAAVYILLPYQRVFTGPPPEGPGPRPRDLDAGEKTVSGILVAAMLALGFAPGLVIDAVDDVAGASSTIVATLAEDSTPGTTGAHSSPVKTDDDEGSTK